MNARRLALTLLAAFASACSQTNVSAVVPDGGGGVPRGGSGGFDAGVPAQGGGVDAGPPADPLPPEEACPFPIPPSNDGLTVPTTRGLVKGAPINSAVIGFLGIPFVAPPVDDLRWRAPVSHACWSTPFAATAYGAECMQKNVISGAVEGQEDCLFLNVWTQRLDGKRPVLFFIHGGANVLGSSNQPVLNGNQYDGQSLAAREDVVVVSTNYRLGPMGFLAHPALDAENAAGSSGNYAILDQIAALQWVRRNIAAFGGDPDQVTIFGESAGAMNTCVLLASPRAAGLFTGALMESGGCETIQQSLAESRGTTFASQKLSCPSTTDSSCLRALSGNAVMAATDAFKLDASVIGTIDPNDGLAGSLPWVANVDGDVLVETPLSALRAGRHNHVPFAIGSNSEEAALFLSSAVILTCDQYAANVTQIFGTSAASVLQEYPCASYATPKAAEVDLSTDMFFTCGARRAARAAADAHVAPVFRYYFTHQTSSILGTGAFHSSELPYVFDTFTAVGSNPSAAELMLSAGMQDAWGAFARDGNPGAVNGTVWPAYDANETSIILDTTISTVDGLKDAHCDFWDQFSGL
jgi:para-nitrobenzyl esterase